MCYDATDVTDVCLAGLLAKSSIYMGTAGIPCGFGTILLPRCHVKASVHMVVCGFRDLVSGALSAYSQRCPTISTNPAVFLLRRCHVQSCVTLAIGCLCCDFLACAVTFTGSSVTMGNSSIATTFDGLPRLRATTK